MQLFSRIRNIFQLFPIQKILLTLVLIVVLTFLFVKTQTVNSAEHNRYNRNLLRLKEVDALLNQDVLKVRQGLLLDYDPLVNDLNMLKQLLNDLEKIPTFINKEGETKTKQQLKVYTSVLQKKENLIENFKSRYSTLRNSLSYFPIITTQLVEKVSSTPANQTIVANLNSLLRDVLIYNLSSSEDLAPQIKAQVGNLLKNRDLYYAAIGRANFEIAIAHIQAILNNKPQVNALTTKLSLQPTLQRSEQIYQTYNYYYQIALNSANIYRLYLYLLSIVLLGYIAHFIRTLRQIAMQVKKAVNQVNVLVEENNFDVCQLADEASKQVQEITLTLNSVEQMAISIQAVADHAHQATAVAHVTSTTAENGSKVMDLTVEGFLTLQETVTETAQKVKHLGESSQQISKAISIINQIAMQTKMLSLNASIEAARAGKEGRGFTAVAEEVRKLAIQSSEATQEIEQMVKNIQQQTSIVVKAMELGNTQALTGTELVENTKESLKQIVEVSHEIDQLVQSISSATVSQAQTSQAVTNLMKQIATVSQRTSDSSRQISSSLHQTVAVTQQLQESVSGFKLGNRK